MRSIFEGFGLILEVLDGLGALLGCLGPVLNVYFLNDVLGAHFRDLLPWGGLTQFSLTAAGDRWGPIFVTYSHWGE